MWREILHLYFSFIYIIQYKKSSAEKNLAQMLAASIVIRSESGVQISSLILLEGGRRPQTKKDRPRGGWVS